jgi:hypothetical protein
MLGFMLGFMLGLMPSLMLMYCAAYNARHSRHHTPHTTTRAGTPRAYLTSQVGQLRDQRHQRRNSCAQSGRGQRPHLSTSFSTRCSSHTGAASQIRGGAARTVAPSCNKATGDADFSIGKCKSLSPDRIRVPGSMTKTAEHPDFRKAN